MTLLARLSVTKKEWVKYDGKDFGESPPLWMLQDFVLRDCDKGMLSVFEVDGEDDLRRIGCAMAFHEDKFGGNKFFVSAQTSTVRECGVDVVSTKSKWAHRFADDRHRELPISSMSELVAVMRCFATAGEFSSFESAELSSTSLAEAKANEFLYRDMANMSSGNKFCHKNLMYKLVRDSAVQISGA